MEDASLMDTAFALLLVTVLVDPDFGASSPLGTKSGRWWW